MKIQPKGYQARTYKMLEGHFEKHYLITHGICAPHEELKMKELDNMSDEEFNTLCDIVGNL